MQFDGYEVLSCIWLLITLECITIVRMLQYLRAIDLPPRGATVGSPSAPNPTYVSGVRSKPPLSQRSYLGRVRVEIFHLIILRA
jgi:hypothetical protein